MVQKSRTIIIILGIYLLYSFVSVISKEASRADTPWELITWIGLLFAVMGVYAIIYQQVIKLADITKVYSLKGVVVIYNLIWAVALYDEIITVGNIIGAVMILAGIYLVGKYE